MRNRSVRLDTELRRDIQDNWTALEGGGIGQGAPWMVASGGRSSTVTPLVSIAPLRSRAGREIEPQACASAKSRPRKRAWAASEDRVGHRRELAQALVAVLTDPEIDLGEALEAHQVPCVDQHRNLDSITCAERQPLQQLPPRRGLARQRLVEYSELHGAWRFSKGRAISSVTRPPPFGMIVLSARKGRWKDPLTSCTVGSQSKGPNMPRRNCSPKSSVSVSAKTTMSLPITFNARHIASPLPSVGPSAPESSSSCTTDSPASSAIRAVSSWEAASTASALSSRPASSSRVASSTIGPIVSETSRAGSTSATVQCLSSSNCGSVNSSAV